MKTITRSLEMGFESIVQGFCPDDGDEVSNPHVSITFMVRKAVEVCKSFIWFLKAVEGVFIS
jgi:hypothetical protein